MSADLKAKLLGTGGIASLVLMIAAIGLGYPPITGLAAVMPLAAAALVCIWAPEPKDKP